MELQTLQDIALRQPVQRALAFETQSTQPGACTAASSPVQPHSPSSSPAVKGLCLSDRFGSSIGLSQAGAMVRVQAEPSSDDAVADDAVKSNVAEAHLKRSDGQRETGVMSRTSLSWQEAHHPAGSHSEFHSQASWA